MKIIRFAARFVLLAPLYTAIRSPLSAQSISLTVDATSTAEKILHVHESIPVKAGPFTFHYPKWIPGQHAPQGPIQGVTGLRFEANGTPISWIRDAFDVFTFHVEIPTGIDRVNANFDFIEPDHNSATAKLIVLEWNSALLYPADIPMTELVFSPRLVLPSGWKLGTSLPIQNQSEQTIRFADLTLERLIDSPVIAGEYYRAINVTPTDEPIQHELDLVADSPAGLDIPETTRQHITNLVAESGKLFGARHYRQYHFLLALSDELAHFGLEHADSSASRLSEQLFLTPGAGMELGELLGHEFVHSWNGKFRRPYDLTLDNYGQPMRTDLLWVYEGLSDFLGSLLATRSGLWTADEYHEYLATTAAALGPGRPGRTWRTLLDTAIAEPGPHGARGWAGWRREADYYEEGGLIWLEIAMTFRHASEGHKSMDDFCHSFYGGPNNGAEVKTYTFDALLRALNQIVSFDWDTLLNVRLNGLSVEPPLTGIEDGGWKLVYDQSPTRLLGPRAGSTDLYSIGLQIDTGGAVSDSLVGSPAFKAGIVSGMKVIGVNDRLYTHDRLEEAISAAHNDRSQTITLIVANDTYIKACLIDYHSGIRYPHLIRDDQQPDSLDQLVTPRVSN